MARRYYSSTAARTTLASGVDDSTVTLSVTAVSGWPTQYPYTLILDKDTVNEELVSVSARSGTTLTVTRGVDGTSGTAHSAGATVEHGVSARDFDEPNAFINGTGTVTETLLASGSVTEAKLGSAAVTEAKLASNSVSATKIVDGTITNSKISASAAIDQSKINNLTSDLASKLSIAGGRILQIVRATDSTERTTTSTSMVDASISVTITPQKSDSAIIVLWSFRSTAPGNGYLDAQITDNSNNALNGAEIVSNGDGSSADQIIGLVLIGYSTPATTSATTYKGRFKVNTGTGNIGNQLCKGQMYAIEVSA